MAVISGSEILARALRKQGIEAMFYIMGGPLLIAERLCIEEGIRSIDVRHEQAAAMMAHAWGRVTNRVAVCMGCSGPGAINLTTGVGNAWADAAPLLAIGGAASVVRAGRGLFQECDQLSVFKPITKWADRCLEPHRIPDMVATALRQATTGRPGPAYLDITTDALNKTVDEDSVVYPNADHASKARQTDLEAVRTAIKVLSKAKRPILMSGTGIIWSDASTALRQFAEQTGIPFYTTPQGRGVIPEDHSLCFLAARSVAFREADCIVIVGTRMNFLNGHFLPPRFSASAKIIQINIDPNEIGLTRPCDVGIVGDARAVLEQLVSEGEEKLNAKLYADWVKYVSEINKVKTEEQEKRMSSDAIPIHPLRLCKEVRDFLDRDAYVIADGQEILNYARRVVPTFEPAHRLNSGPWGTMGVGVPFGVGVKLAHPDKQVLVLQGDGSFGMNGMELDTAVRHKINVVCVVSLNGGWTADPKGIKPGRDLGYTRYDKLAEVLGCHGEYVEAPSEIRPALERAFSAGRPALVNVKTDHLARAATVEYLKTKHRINDVPTSRMLVALPIIVTCRLNCIIGYCAGQ